MHRHHRHREHRPGLRHGPRPQWRRGDPRQQPRAGEPARDDRGPRADDRRGNAGAGGGKGHRPHRGELVEAPAALADLPDFGGRIVIDANNPIEGPLFKPAELAGRASSAVFSDLVPGARGVKAFNHLQPHLLAGDPGAEGGKRVLFYSGDDAGDKSEIGALVDRLGFFGIDLGALAVGARLVQFPGGPLPALNLVRFG